MGGARMGNLPIAMATGSRDDSDDVNFITGERQRWDSGEVLIVINHSRLSRDASCAPGVYAGGRAALL